MRTLERHNASIWYRVAGRGPAVVFANAWATSAEMWRLVIERMAPRFRCIGYDMRGVGRSLAGHEASFELDDHVEDLLAVCEAENVYDAHLVGHELGGRIAALAVRMHPQLAATLTISGWWGAAEVNEALGRIDRFKQAASLLLRDLGSFPVLRNVVGWSYRRVPEPERTELLDRFAEVDARGAYVTAQAASDPVARAAFNEAVGQLRLPMLLIAGAEDREAARAGLRGLYERLPDVTLATIRGAAAMPMLEYPRQFARTLADFISEHADREQLAIKEERA